MASPVNHTVRLPRCRSASLYSDQFVTRRFGRGIWWRRSALYLCGMKAKPGAALQTAPYAIPPICATRWSPRPKAGRPASSARRETGRPDLEAAALTCRSRPHARLLREALTSAFNSPAGETDQVLLDRVHVERPDVWNVITDGGRLWPKPKAN